MSGWSVSLILRLGAAVLLTSVVAVSSAIAGSSARPFKVTSTLDGKRVLPLRIHWIARPRIRTSKVAEVEYLIDGRLAWVEHFPPYFYGDDGNWLVTTFLTPGLHRFTVRAISVSGRKASDRVEARVLPAPAPPPQLAGTWTRIATGFDPAGRWTVTINKVGWLFGDPMGGGLNDDVSYPEPGQVLIRAAIEEPVFGRYDRGGSFCDREPDPPVLYAYTTDSTGNALTLTPIGSPDDCRHSLLAGTWTRVS